MNIAAYCRVSTDKEYPLNRLEVQKQSFHEHTQKNHYTSARLCADEGITGTSMKHPGFQKMLTAIEAYTSRRCSSKIIVR